MGEGEVTRWMSKGVCAQTDPEAFFPEVGQSSRVAKSICGRCEVSIQCLDFALADLTLLGVWGGLSHLERRQLKKAA